MEEFSIFKWIFENGERIGVITTLLTVIFGLVQSLRKLYSQMREDQKQYEDKLDEYTRRFIKTTEDFANELRSIASDQESSRKTNHKILNALTILLDDRR